MYRSIDVMTEMRKLADSKPVHAAAGASVLASQTLGTCPGGSPIGAPKPRDLAAYPRERVRADGTDQRHRGPCRTHGPTRPGPCRTHGPTRPGPCRTHGPTPPGPCRTHGPRLPGGYDTLAAHGKKALNGQSNAAQSKSTTAAQSKTAVNGRAKGKTTSRTTTSH